MNFCQQLVNDAIKAESIEQLAQISNKADEMYLSEGNEETREQMTHDFWIEFTKIFRKKALSFKHKQIN